MDQVPRRAFYVALGQLLKAERIRLGRTQLHVALEVGTHASHLSCVERGDTPSAQLVWDIATMFCISPSGLLREAAAIAMQSAGP